MQAIDRIELPLLDGGRSSTPSDLRPSLATTLYHKKLQMFLSATKGRCPVDRELRPYERSRWAEHGRSCSVVEVCPPHRGQSWSHHLRSRATLRDGARAKGRAWEDGEHHGAAPDVSIIEAGAPAFGCTVHPLRLQAPPPLTRTRAPARAIVQRHPVGQEEGTVGRASRARLSTPRPLTPLLSGTCLTSSGRPPLREMLATKGPGRPEGYPGQITYSTRCNDDTARECTRFPPRRPATRPRARGSASRRSTSKLLARALERRNAPLRYRRDPRVGARGVR